MRQTSYCMNCGDHKGSNFLADYCDGCFAAIEGAQAAAVAEGGDMSAARRAALAERAHHAHRNFVDPRAIDRNTIWRNGNIPPGVIPEKG